MDTEKDLKCRMDKHKYIY